MSMITYQEVPEAREMHEVWVVTQHLNPKFVAP